jgi:predicted secreted hydrolase
MGEPHRVWNEDWELTLREGRHHLKAEQDGCGIDLVLTSRKPIVIHGEGGISRKGEQDGNASHYYSLTRLLTNGSLTIGGERLAVTGTSWMDHEFGTSFLEEGDLGWDWFSLQLEDGRELMLYRFRRAGETISPYSSGTLIERDGQARHLRLDDFRLTPGARWRSPATGADYPIDWTVEIPDLGLSLQVEAAFPEQELDAVESAGVSYWEGAVRATGSQGETRIEGLGYLEMTGYAGRGMREIFEE